MSPAIALLLFGAALLYFSRKPATLAAEEKTAVLAEVKKSNAPQIVSEVEKFLEQPAGVVVPELSAGASLAFARAQEQSGIVIPGNALPLVQSGQYGPTTPGEIFGDPNVYLRDKAPGVVTPVPTAQVVKEINSSIASGKNGLFTVLQKDKPERTTVHILPYTPPEPVAVLSAGPSENTTTVTLLGSGQRVEAFQSAPASQLRLLDGSFALGVLPLTAKNVALEQLRRIRAGESGTVDASLRDQVSKQEAYVNTLPYNISASDLARQLAFAGLGFDTGTLSAGLKRVGLM